MYFSIKNNFCYVIRRLTIFSVFEHLLDCTKVCDTMRIKFVLAKTDNQRMFEDIVIDERDFTKSFLHFFKPTSRFFLKICYLYSCWINLRLAKVHKCMYFLYLNSFFLFVMIWNNLKFLMGKCCFLGRLPLILPIV